MVTGVGMDIGRHAVKAVTANRQVTFPSAVGEGRERRLTSGGNYEVKIDGEWYFVGELAAESYFERRMVSANKVHQEALVLCFTALNLLQVQNAIITTGIPIYQHTPEEKSALSELLYGTHEVTVNGKVSTITVEHVGVAAEGPASFWDAYLGMDGKPVPSKEEWKKNKVRGIDLGSRTINFFTVDKCRYIDKESDTLRYGLLEVDNATEDRERTDDDRERFTRRAVADIWRRWPGYKPTDPIILANGGAVELRPWLEQHFPPQAIYLDEFSTARGCYKMGAARGVR